MDKIYEDLLEILPRGQRKAIAFNLDNSTHDSRLYIFDSLMLALG